MVDFLAVWVALYGTHDLADHWVQTACQANRKAQSRAHCLRHVLTYGATQCAALLALTLAFGVDLEPGWLVVGMALNLATHYFADRRAPLRRIAALFPGKANYWDNGGAYPLDQSWHKGWIFVSAFLIAL